MFIPVSNAYLPMRPILMQLMSQKLSILTGLLMSEFYYYGIIDFLTFCINTSRYLKRKKTQFFKLARIKLQREIVIIIK